MFKNNKAGLWLCILGLSGCAIPQKHAETIDLDGYSTYTITYPTELRGTYFFENDGKVRYCAEPVPDVALETVQKLTATLTATLAKAESIEGEVATDLSNKVVQLAGRTELLLLAREMLYRACELSLNHPKDDAAAMSLYTRVADLVERLGDAEKITARAELAREQQRALDAGGKAFDKIKRDDGADP
jgi:hypothetical protein